MNNPKFRSKCPYCGHIQTNNLYHAPESQAPQLVGCDDEQGGCGERYAVALRVDVVVDQTFRLERVKESARRK